jgi:hypothetical protein
VPRSASCPKYLRRQTEVTRVCLILRKSACDIADFNGGEGRVRLRTQSTQARCLTLVTNGDPGRIGIRNGSSRWRCSGAGSLCIAPAVPPAPGRDDRLKPWSCSVKRIWVGWPVRRRSRSEALTVMRRPGRLLCAPLRHHARHAHSPAWGNSTVTNNRAGRCGASLAWHPREERLSAGEPGSFDGTYDPANGTAVLDVFRIVSKRPRPRAGGTTKGEH